MVAVEAASMVAEAAVAIENSSPITAAERHKSASPSGMLFGSKEDFSCVI
jgi:hypothetical protein